MVPGGGVGDGSCEPTGRCHSGAGLEPTPQHPLSSNLFLSPQIQPEQRPQPTALNQPNKNKAAVRQKHEFCHLLESEPGLSLTDVLSVCPRPPPPPALCSTCAGVSVVQGADQGAFLSESKVPLVPPPPASPVERKVMFCLGLYLLPELSGPAISINTWCKVIQN